MKQTNLNLNTDTAVGPLLWRLSALLLGVGLLVVGVGLLFSVLGLRAGLADFSSIALGLVTSAYFVGFVVGTFACPVVIRKVGHIRAFAAMASLASTMPILHAFWIEPWFWGVLRLITGICMVGLYIVVESWLNALAPNALRGRLFAVYMAINFVALALGQWLILVGDRLGFVPFAMVSVMFSFALLPITMTRVAEPAPVEASPPVAVETPPSAVGGQWKWPASGTVIAGFNESSNKGLDIGGAVGEPVYAAAAGKVGYAGSGLRGYGKLIVIKHNQEYNSVYAHNDKLLVKEDDQVAQGQKIAELGSSETDRPKLHFEIRKQGKAVDPTGYLPAR